MRKLLCVIPRFLTALDGLSGLGPRWGLIESQCLQATRSTFGLRDFERSYSFGRTHYLAKVQPTANLILYRIEVVTGDVRGAGSPVPAAFMFSGENGDSEEFVFGDEEEGCGFDRGTKQKYTIFSKNLGKLCRLHVRQLGASTTVTGAGWFLDRVIVKGPQGEKWIFPCHAWFGKSDAGGEYGSTERLLNVMDETGTHSLSEAEYPLLLQPLKLEVSAFSIPHPEKVALGVKGQNRKGMGQSGEDAYFYSHLPGGLVALAVADGIYMWRDKGIDAGEFSRHLLQSCRKALEDGNSDALHILQLASSKVIEEQIQGSSTICLVLLDPSQGRLAAANLGDSGFILLGRNGDTKLKVKYRSPQQEHSFGHPYQLGSHETADKAEDALLSISPVASGDIIVMGTDGLYDNVSDVQICDVVNELLIKQMSASKIAQELAFLAFNHSLDKKMETPYSAAATETFDMVYNGGKADDITVVCAIAS